MLGLLSVSLYPSGQTLGLVLYFPFSALDSPSSMPYFRLTLLYWIAFGLLYFLVFLALLHYLWLVLEGKMGIQVLRRIAFGTLLLFLLLGVATATIPLPFVPLSRAAAIVKSQEP